MPMTPAQTALRPRRYGGCHGVPRIGYSHRPRPGVCREYGAGTQEGCAYGAKPRPGISRRGQNLPYPYDSVSPVPRRAALIVDGRWLRRVAAGARNQACSRRTTVYGQDNTLGCLDYSNCEILYFPRDTARWMIVPVTRSKRIPAGRGIDREGIAPDVRIPLPLPATLADNGRPVGRVGWPGN